MPVPGGKLKAYGGHPMEIIIGISYVNPAGTRRHNGVDATSARHTDVSTMSFRRHLPASVLVSLQREKFVEPP